MQRLRTIIAAATLCGIGFLSPWWFLSIVGCALFFTQVPTTKREALKYSLVFSGIIQGLAYYALYFDTIPLPWLHNVPIIWHIAYVGVAWAYTVFFATIPFALWGLLYFRYASSSLSMKLCVVPAGWVIAEWLSSMSISLGTINTSWSPLSPTSSIGYLGNQLADNPLLLEVASWGGVYALSLLVIAIGILFGEFLKDIRIRSTKQYLYAALSICLVVAGSYAHFNIASSSKHLAITLVTTYTPSVFVLTPEIRMQADQHIGDIIVNNSSDIVVLPEATEFIKRNHLPLVTAFSASTSQSRPIIIDSESVLDGTTRMRRGEYFNAVTDTAAYTSKEFLVPFGEYIPSPIRSIASVLAPQFMQSFGRDRVYVPGTNSLYQMHNGTTIALRMCNEVVSADLYSNDTANGAQILLNSAAHSWYNDSYKVERQIVRAAKIRAVENHRFLAMADSGAPSFALDWYGQVIAKSEWHSEDPLVVSVLTSSEITPYTMLGRWELLVPLFLVLISITDAVQRLRRFLHPFLVS